MSKIEEKIDEAARKYAKNKVSGDFINKDAFERAFITGAKFALSHQWRSTKDEKPNGNEKMLYILRDGSLSLGYFVNDDYQRFWLPIPPLPKARKEEEV